MRSVVNMREFCEWFVCRSLHEEALIEVEIVKIETIYVACKQQEEWRGGFRAGYQDKFFIMQHYMV